MVLAPTLTTLQRSGHSSGHSIGSLGSANYCLCVILVEGLNHSGPWFLHLDGSNYIHLLHLLKISEERINIWSRVSAQLFLLQREGVTCTHRASPLPGDHTCLRLLSIDEEKIGSGQDIWLVKINFCCFPSVNSGIHPFTCVISVIPETPQEGGYHTPIL